MAVARGSALGAVPLERGAQLGLGDAERVRELLQVVLASGRSVGGRVGAGGLERLPEGGGGDAELLGEIVERGPSRARRGGRGRRGRGRDRRRSRCRRCERRSLGVLAGRLSASALPLPLWLPIA